MSGSWSRHAFDLRLTVRAPFLFRTIDAPMHGYDEAQMRDFNEHPVLPRDQIRGVFVDAFGRMKAVAPDHRFIAALAGAFGGDSTSDEDEGDKPNRSRLIFADLTARELGAAPLAPSYRVKIDETTGAAEAGALQVIEQVARPGADIAFDGSVVLFGTQEEADALVALFDTALKITPAIGAMKSAGFGEIVAGSSSLKPRTPAQALAMPAASPPLSDTPLVFDATFDRPLLVDARRIADNAFLGSEIVPGAVIKGGLAARLERSGEDPGAGDLGRVLAAIRISHAFPLPENAADGAPPAISRLPASLIATTVDRDTRIGDALHLEADQAALLHGQAPFFPIDWKDAAFGKAFEATGLAGHAALRTVARTRTRIKDDVADDGQLFTMIARSNRHDSGALVRFRFTFDASSLSSESDRQLAEQLVCVLEEGLDGLGKTDASACFSRVAGAVSPQPKPIAGTSDSFAILLRTPALMLDLNALHDDAGNWRCTPFDAYAAYWEQVLPGARLANFYATQSLAGGYLAHRRRLYGGARYYPFLLTDAGSVFRVTGVDPDRLSVLMRSGLPLPPFEGVDAARVGWRTCPFVPENGYGEILADYLSDPAKVKALRDEVSHV